jgi:hypothetical protein
VYDSEDTGVILSKHSGNNYAEIPSCLDALDDQLLASPIDSFVDVCWAEAVGEHDSVLERDSPTLYNAPISAPQVFDTKALDNYHDLDPLDSDSEQWDGGMNVPVKAYIKHVCIDIQSRG